MNAARDEEIIQLIDDDDLGYDEAARALDIRAERARLRHHRAVERQRNERRSARLRREEGRP